MIQRIQSIYLLLVAVLTTVSVFLFSLWKVNESKIVALDLLTSEVLLLQLIPVSFLIAVLLALIAVFMFGNRKLQFVLNRFNILINLFLLGVLLYYLLNVSGEMNISEKGIGVFIPIINVLLLVLANKAIQKDENLVKSVDRLR